MLTTQQKQERLRREVNSQYGPIPITDVITPLPTPETLTKADAEALLAMGDVVARALMKRAGASMEFKGLCNNVIISSAALRTLLARPDPLSVPFRANIFLERFEGPADSSMPLLQVSRHILLRVTTIVADL